MADVETLLGNLTEHFSAAIQSSKIACGEVTIEVTREDLINVCRALRDEKVFAFNMLVDVCGVDYLQYGLAEWETQEATLTGFERGVDREFMENPASRDARNAAFDHQAKHFKTPRFAAVYHLLSLTNNHRVRIRVLLEEDDLLVPSVIDIWPSANWYEREAFDLFGIMFHNHPDLRRLLTDYGFVGHPFRKDFPLIGNVEVRYDGKLRRVIYEAVSIEPRVLEPKVIRDDNRYEVGK
jgi:NADH-quinone oxidoreductase subunit C